MTQTRIEHVNITVSSPERTAAMLNAIFGWEIRWEGPSTLGGYTIHVGSETDYLAVYAASRDGAEPVRLRKGRPLNHVGIEVDDLDEIERRVIVNGLEPFSHGDYEPGRRFYFFDENGIEFEVVSYSDAA